MDPLVSTFELEGQRLLALNGGPEFKFTETVSLFVSCLDQAEVDYYWNALAADGGSEGQCGWLKDKFGLSRQVVPEILLKLTDGRDKEKSQKVMQAVLKMKKLDADELKKAYAS